MSRKSSHPLVFLWVCVVVAVLSGCAAKTHSIPVLVEDEGALVFKVVVDQAERTSTTWIGASHIELWRTGTDQVEAEPEGESAMQPIEAVETETFRRSASGTVALAGSLQTTRGTYVYRGMLKPGRYRILGLVGSSPVFGTWRMPLRSVLDTVEVREGEVTYLGTLVVKPRAEPLQKKDRVWTRPVALGYVLPGAELIESFQRNYPDVAAQVGGKPVHVLEFTPELNSATQQAQQFKRDSSRAVNGLWQDDKGNFFAGSRLGKVLLKKAGQPEWSEVDTGSWDEVTVVRPYRGGLLAGGEDGLLRFSADGGKTWRPLAPPLWGHVQHLEVLPNGTLLTLIRVGAAWSAYVTDDALAGAWRKLGDMISAEQAKLLRGSNTQVFVHPGYPPTVVLHGDNLILTEQGTTSLVSMNTQTGRVELLAPPPMGILHGMTTLPGGLLVLNGAVFKNATYISTDGAKTWTEDKTRGLLAFRNDKVGYSLYGPDFAITRDGGATWVYPRKSARWTVEDLRYFVIDRSDGALVAVLFDGGILRSQDEGKSWVKEH